MDYGRKRPPRKEPSAYQNVMKYVSLLMVLLYCGMGTYVLVATQAQLPLPEQYRYIIGGMLLFYGFIRFVRAYQIYFKKNRHDEDN